MAILLTDRLDTTGNIVTPTITLASLASSSTVGRQSSPVTLVDASQRVPPIIDVELTAVLTTGTVANDKAAYLYMAPSLDETNYAVGPPTLGSSDAAFTFSNSPVGTSPLPADFALIGMVTFNAQSETRRRVFRVVNPPAKFIFVVLNYSGIAFASSGSAIKIRKRWGEVASV